MRKVFLCGAAMLLALQAAPAFAVPMCDGPRFDDEDGVHLGITFGFGRSTEEEAAQLAEIRLQQQGIDAHQTRFWNGCIQTFVRENGHETMRFYDPDTLEEVPVN